MNCPHTKDIQIHGSVTVGSKGQIVIPVKARKKLDIKEGDKLMVITKGSIAVGLIKTQDMKKMVAYLNHEIEKTTTDKQ